MNYLYGNNHIFVARDGEPNVYIKGGDGQELVAENLTVSKLTVGGDFVFVSSLDDLPTAVNGVISLNNDRFYVLTQSINLQGARIVVGNSNVIGGLALTAGGSSPVKLLSTGLSAGTPLITSNDDSLVLQNFEIGHVYGLYFNNVSSNKNLYIYGVIFNTCTTYPVYINGASSIKVENCNFFLCSDFYFVGGIASCLIKNSNFANINNAENIVVDTGTNIAYYFQVQDSLFTNVLTDCINFSPSVVIPAGRYRVYRCLFNNNGVTGVLPTDNKADFQDCYGNIVQIPNSGTNGSFYVFTTSSTALTVNVWALIAGTTIQNSTMQRFTHNNAGRLTYIGTYNKVFTVHFSVVLEGTTGDNMTVGVGKNGADPVNETRCIGKFSGTTLTLSTSFQTRLEKDDYLELFVKNLTGSNPIIATTYNLSVS